jgi:hypothetical protein
MSVPMTTRARRSPNSTMRFLPANGVVESGHHHEIYLSDPRKTAPEKLKTILRQPVKAKRQRTGGLVITRR